MQSCTLQIYLMNSLEDKSYFSGLDALLKRKYLCVCVIGNACNYSCKDLALEIKIEGDTCQ
jgi:hypothetical protein